QIAVCRVNFHTIRPRLNGTTGSVTKIGNCLLNVFQRHGARNGHVLHASYCMNLLLGCDGGWRQCLQVARHVVGMRHATRMHDLDKEMPTFFMDGGCDPAPALNVCIRVDTGSGDSALPYVGWLRGFSHDQ